MKVITTICWEKYFNYQ